MKTIAFLMTLNYTLFSVGGIAVNEFEKDVQSKNNDVVEAGRGFIYSFLFFMVIFFVGTIFKVIGS